MDDCDEIMTLGSADVSYMSIFNDFDEAVRYDKDMVHGRIIDDFSMVTIDSVTTDNHESTLGTGSNYLENDTWAHINLYSGQVEGAFELFGNSIETNSITANISGSNCDHGPCVEDELLSNCDHMSFVKDELLSNCDTKESIDDDATCLVEDESDRLCGMHSISLNFVDHDHTCQQFHLENDFYNKDSVQDPTFEDMMNYSGSNKPSEF